MKGNRFILLAAGALLTSNLLSAALSLEVNPVVSFQQTTNNPCVIGDSSCKQPSGFFDAQESGTPAVYNLFSAVYVDANNPAVQSGDRLPVTFNIGIDVNYAGNPTDASKFEYLVFFKTFICSGTDASGGPAVSTGNRDSSDDTVVANGTGAGGGNCPVATLDSANSYIPATPTAMETHNGNGFSDAILSTLSLTPGTFYVFEAQISNDSDGMEEFFVIPSGTAGVPEPASMILFGTALLIVGRVLHRRLPM